MLRADAHSYLTDAAHLIRSTRPGMSLADAMELAALREPETARLLSDGIETREARGQPSDKELTVRREDALAVRVRDYCAGPDGKIDRVRLRAVAELNGVWRDHWERLSQGSLVAAVMARLRSKTEVKFP